MVNIQLFYYYPDFAKILKVLIINLKIKFLNLINIENYLFFNKLILWNIKAADL